MLFQAGSRHVGSAGRDALELLVVHYSHRSQRRCSKHLDEPLALEPFDHPVDSRCAPFRDTVVLFPGEGSAYFAVTESELAYA